jgi:hypothetical protein
VEVSDLFVSTTILVDSYSDDRVEWNLNDWKGNGRGLC